MKQTYKHIVTVMLVLSMLACAILPAYAAREKEYLCDLRIIYADDYNEAKQILAETEFADYKILGANLNENTGKIGVWLAYKTTTDIEDAITDIAIMQMNGGYHEGNYQEVIKQSYAQYVAMAENYLVAIEYFANAYHAGHYLSNIAYRQLNFYNVVTEGIDEEPEFEGELLGNIFLGDIEATELGTMFMEGNSYALTNIRSLIAMGVSYNEDGMTYLEKVADEAEKYSHNNGIYANEHYDDLAAMMVSTIVVLRKSFEELEAKEEDINWLDDEISNLELQYMETKLMAEMLSEVGYLDGKTLYQFCLAYTANQDDYSALYPLVAALNEGQAAMTKVAHFYDVVRYSVTLAENEDIENELTLMEEKYSEKPFNVYTGVDRTIYRDTFALTKEAYRADAFTESGLSASLFNGYNAKINTAAKIVGSVGVGLVGAGLALHGYTKFTTQKALNAYNDSFIEAMDSYAYSKMSYVSGHPFNWGSPNEAVNTMFNRAVFPYTVEDAAYADWTFAEKLDYLDDYYTEKPKAFMNDLYATIRDKYDTYMSDHDGLTAATDKLEAAQNFASTGMKFVYGMYIAGGIMALSSAITLGIGVYNYYNPTYSDIPTAMVDLIDTVDGDRYIKYDVVYEAELQKDGNYAAADLNAFKAQRWNALYFTKSYEAGKPLLADEFVISTNNHVPAENYMPVHRFGEVVSYNLNKYNFNESYSIYLSVKQSENQKSAVADVPGIVGSMFSSGWLFLTGGLGLLLGAGGTIGAQELIRKRKIKA